MNLYLPIGPAQQDFEWDGGGGGGGGGGVSQILFLFVCLFVFFWGGGGVEACYPGKIRVLVTLRYRKVDLKLTNSVLN